MGVVVAARNEEGTIARVLQALDEQTMRPVDVVVVDDGSTDRTSAVVKESSEKVHFRLTVVALPFHSGNYVARPELAHVFNSGLRVLRAKRPSPDYVMILGGDHILPPLYDERIISRLEGDKALAVASGWIADEPFWGHAPRGSSMVARAEFWELVGGLLFPVNYGWESWLYLKAMQLGYRTRSFKDIPTHVSRVTRYEKGALYGRAMYVLGYDFAYALGRCLVLARTSPRAALQMLLGYLDHRGLSKLDVSSGLGREQRRVILRRVANIVKHHGRR